MRSKEYHVDQEEEEIARLAAQMDEEGGDTGGYSTSEYSQISRTLDTEMRRYVHEF